ncbi:MAG TPA: efflux RND transporter periplasmic adaptor subunit [Gammaproteobacteria bacterium]
MYSGTLSSRSAPSLVVTALVFAALFLAGCSGSEQAPGAAGGARPPMPVTVLEMQPQSIPVSLEVVARTEGALETEVRARVGGMIVERLYREGETVKAGQPLFQIDRSTYEIALADARARADRAARELKRLKGLIESNAVSRTAYDDAVSNNEIAQAALRQAQLNLSWTTVTAPVAGTTGRALKSEGNLVSPGSDSLLTSIYQLDPIWVRFSLAESDIARLPEGRLDADSISGVELTLGNGSVYRDGRLNFVASTIDPVLGTRQLRAEFDNADGRLLPGQFVRARLLFGERSGVFLVPQAALLQTDTGRLVMVADAESKVAPRPVQTAGWHGQDWVVVGGLQAGDRVIVDNLIKLRPGMPVAPKQPEAPAQGKQAPAAAESSS